MKTKKTSAIINKTKYEILRNIFCVAASRGKEHIIFVTNKKHELLDEKTLSTPVKTNFDYFSNAEIEKRSI